MAGNVTIKVNGTLAELPGSMPLLAAVRDRLGLTGAKPGCGEGACGACTMLLDGEPVRSCQRTVESAAGQAITTIEGLGPGGRLHPVQKAFCEESAAQCGYCTPGMVLVTAALLDRDPRPGDAAIDAALASQICRCGSYQRIRAAVHRASDLVTGVGSSVPGDAVEDSEPADDLDPATGEPDGDRWGPPVPGGPQYRPIRPWNLTDPADRDWFEILGDGLVVLLERDPSGAATWTTASSAWLHVRADGLVTAFTGKVDVGQDNRTALRLLVAEELGVPLDRVRLAMGDTDLCPYDMGTFGSRSMPDAGGVLRSAAAYARTVLPVRPGERRVEHVSGEQAVSDPASWRLAGRPHRSPGAIAAVTGARRFVSDLYQSGIWHGALLRPPVPAARLRSLDSAAIAARADVIVVQTQDIVGAVAADPSAAADAVIALEAAASWDMSSPLAGTVHSHQELDEYLRAHPSTGGPGRWGGPHEEQQGSAASAMESAAVRREATYTAAYIAPAALETRVAVAVWDVGRLTVWTGTQTPFPVRAQLAAALAVPEHDVRVIVPATGGGFGGKHAAGIAIEAAVLAREAGRPVRVAWSRREEFTVGTLRPAAVMDIAAGVAADGTLSGWTHLNINAGAAGIGTPYLVADRRLEYRPAESPLPQASYRALAATANNFARESMIDELAHEAGVDPVEFRLRNLADDRLAAVLRAVAEHIGWEADHKHCGWQADHKHCGWEADHRHCGWERGREPVPGIGVGIACGLEKDGRVVTAAQVVIERGRQVRVTGLITGYECGTIVNPHAVRSQIEGATVMAFGGAMFEAIRFAGGAITNAAFSAYRVPRLVDIPPIEVVLLSRPDLPPAGAGETPMIAVAPAIASAIFEATGRRLRSLPLTADGVLPV